MIANKQNLLKSLTDWAKVDAHVLSPEDFEDAPELTDAMVARAEISHGEQLIRLGEGPLTQALRGRPKSANPKQQRSIRFSPDVLAYFRATGKGWQTRMDAALKEWIAGQKDKAG